MSKKVTTSTPKLFIGIDIHKKSWKVHFCTDISEGNTATFAPSASKLKKYVSKYFMVYTCGECCRYNKASKAD